MKNKISPKIVNRMLSEIDYESNLREGFNESFQLSADLLREILPYVSKDGLEIIAKTIEYMSKTGVNRETVTYGFVDDAIELNKEQKSILKTFRKDKIQPLSNFPMKAYILSQLDDMGLIERVGTFEVRITKKGLFYL